jgi:hypothetical protein
MRKSRYKDIGFWVVLSLIIGYVIHLQIWRKGSDSLRAEAPNATDSAYLTLDQLDTTSKFIKATLFISAFRKTPEKSDGKDKEKVVNDKEKVVNDKETVVKDKETVVKDKETVVIESVSESPGLGTPQYDKRKELSSDDKRDKKPEDAAVLIPVELRYESKPFFYPFESYTLDMHIVFKKKNIAPPPAFVEPPLRLEVRSKISEIALQSCSAHYSFRESETPGRTNNFSVTLDRNPYPRSIAVILFAAAAVFLFFISRLEETSKVVSISLGYLATVWASHQIIIGTVALFPTVVDFVTLMLFVFVLAIVVHKSLYHNDAAKSTEPRPRSRVRLFRKTVASRKNADSDQHKHRWHFYE